MHVHAVGIRALHTMSRCHHEGWRAALAAEAGLPLPVRDALRVGEEAGIERRKNQSGFTQRHAPRGGEGDIQFGMRFVHHQCEPRAAVGQAKQCRRNIAEALGAHRGRHPFGSVGCGLHEGLAFAVQDEEACARRAFQFLDPKTIVAALRHAVDVDAGEDVFTGTRGDRLVPLLLDAHARQPVMR